MMGCVWKKFITCGTHKHLIRCSIPFFLTFLSSFFFSGILYFSYFFFFFFSSILRLVIRLNKSNKKSNKMPLRINFTQPTLSNKFYIFLPLMLWDLHFYTNVEITNVEIIVICNI